MDVFLALLFLGFLLAIPVFLIILAFNAIKKKPLKKTITKLKISLLGAIVTFILFAIVVTIFSCDHEYITIETVEATCLSEGKIVQQCSLCNDEKEEVLPLLEHSWQEPNCTTPKTCVLCGLTEGSIAGHSWIDATCTTPKTCSVCASTEGDALSVNKTHTWEKATCTAPKTCSVCKATEGSTIPHIASKWEIIEDAIGEEQGTRQQKCTVCGEILSTEKFYAPTKMATNIIESVVKQHSGETSLELVTNEKTGEISITGGIICENNETVVLNILQSICDQFYEENIEVECILVIGDIEDGFEGEALALASVTKDECNLSVMSTNFKTERNMWINNQFSAWDGSHTVLKSLIKKNLNDEKSFEHIETTYIDIDTKDKKTQVNNMLKQAGYPNRVDIGDLFIATEFSAKNVFNATVKNTAYGIVDQSEDNVILIGIE